LRINGQGDFIDNPGSNPVSDVGNIFATNAVDLVATGAGPGGGPQVVVSDHTGRPLFQFFAFDPAFTGGVRVAVGDVNGDGVPDVICGAGPGGGPQVRVIDGHSRQELVSFFAFDAGFTGGVYVAAG